MTSIDGAAHISNEPLRLTVVYEDAGDGWVMASVPEVPGVLTQGATIEHARAMIHSALRDWLEHQIQGLHGQLPTARRGIGSEPLRTHHRPVNSTPPTSLEPDS